MFTYHRQSPKALPCSCGSDMLVWVGHSCPTPLTLFLILPLTLTFLTSFVILLLTWISGWSSHAEANSRKKIRLPPHAPPLSKSRKDVIHHLLQSQSHPLPSRSPGHNPPTLPSRSR